MRSGRKGFRSELVSNDSKWSRKGPEVEVECSMSLRGLSYESRGHRVRLYNEEGEREKVS